MIYKFFIALQKTLIFIFFKISNFYNKIYIFSYISKNISENKHIIYINCKSFVHDIITSMQFKNKTKNAYSAI